MNGETSAPVPADSYGVSRSRTASNAPGGRCWAVGGLQTAVALVADNSTTEDAPEAMGWSAIPGSIHAVKRPVSAFVPET